MKENIAILYGGNSSEREISILSAQNVATYLRPEKYNVYQVLVTGTHWTVDGVEVDKTHFCVTLHGTTVKFDKALIMIHGTPGEDGLLTSYFEMFQIPTCGCSAGVSFLTFNKYACKCFLRDAGVRMARDLRLTPTTAGDYTRAQVEAMIGPFPWFVKPNANGSSYGVSKIRSWEEWEPALEKAFAQDEEVLVEEFIGGRELTNGVLKTPQRHYVLPVTEIIPAANRDFFDYQAKYNGESSEVTPAQISEELAAKVQQETSFIYDYLGCKGVVRMDYIEHNGELYFLEVNTIPGMTAMSLVPQQVRAAGHTMEDFFDHILDQA